ncbi:MAG TPA: hypothetical protein VFS41_12555, partial [Edaphobacter sp.]|nr:hypothetical protein [Edaphobacter sp.]
LSYLLCIWITRGRFGRTLAAIRVAENRMRYLGYNPALFKIFAFAMAAGLSGLAGALFVPQVGIISPANVGIIPSIEVVIWVAVGGRGTLLGAVIGAILVNGAQSLFSETFPNTWLYAYALLFICTVLYFPTGLIGLGEKVKSFLSRKQATDLSQASEAEPIPSEETVR